MRDPVDRQSRCARLGTESTQVGSRVCGILRLPWHNNRTTFDKLQARAGERHIAASRFYSASASASRFQPPPPVVSSEFCYGKVAKSRLTTPLATTSLPLLELITLPAATACCQQRL